ncbi:Pre-mRNA-splicing factor cwf19 [Malassezia sp. CBS 17886]|nr:Pre-mRNA-splicing factor cwf19 [Malassezia sp. CBS 17886]
MDDRSTKRRRGDDAHDRGIDDVEERAHRHARHRAERHERHRAERHERHSRRQEQDPDDALHRRTDAATERVPSPGSTSLRRDDWMLGGSGGAAPDFFSNIGAEKPMPPQPAKPRVDNPAVNARELNPMLRSGAPAVDERAPAAEEPRAYGGPGHQWRMMKLRRTYDMANEAGLPVEDVALERYGDTEAFNEARAERQFLDDQRGPSRDTSELNRLEARVLRAELAGRPEAAALRAELEEAKRSTGAQVREQAVPVLDGMGRMYDIGTGNDADVNEEAEASAKMTANQHRRVAAAAETEDVSLNELVRQERMGAGRGDQKDADAMMAHQIASDYGFEANHDYMEQEAQRFARKKMRDDAMKRQFAIQDFARTKHALDTCPFCWQDDGETPPSAAIVCSGTCAYLALPDREGLAEGHCWIVPMQHHVSSLDVDENGWTEIRNFMKCLIRMAAARGASMVFFETVVSLRQQKHTYIEAVPLPADVFQEIPAYFKTALSDVESEWSDHAKIIYFSPSRPFQRSMVSRLPYFMVQWDYKGERGYGHVIEERDDEGPERTRGRRRQTHDLYEAPTYDDGDRLGGRGFPTWFAQEVIGSMLDLEPQRWRRPRAVQGMPQRLARFRDAFQPYDWTVQVA